MEKNDRYSIFIPRFCDTKVFLYDGEKEQEMVTPEEKAALAEQRWQHDDTATEDAEHAVWLCVHDEDASGFDDLMAMLHDVATSEDIAVMHQVLRAALAQVKERDESPAGQLWDRLVGIIKENAQ